MSFLQGLKSRMLIRRMLTRHVFVRVVTGVVLFLGKRVPSFVVNVVIANADVDVYDKEFVHRNAIRPASSAEGGRRHAVSIGRY